jgi:F-type H+-transporting ATPase subunit b
MDLIKPELGLFFWTLVIFLALFFVLRTFAWKAILNGIESRNLHIAESLQKAAEAEARLQELTAKNEDLLQQARIEQDKILREANRQKNEIVEAARAEAGVQKDKILADARQQIQQEKNAAVEELKTFSANLALELAEKVLRKQLDSPSEQKQYVNTLLSGIRLN